MTTRTSIVLNAPQPRSKLYTTGSAYRTAAAAVLGLDDGAEGVRRLERALEEMHPGCRAIAVPMARTGIYLTLKHILRPGQKVILSPYTISDVVNMVLCAGGVPLFADIESGGSFNIDASAVASLLETEDDVGAVLVTHFYGLICDIPSIAAVCAKRGVSLIEDAAQAFGARLGDRSAGSIGNAGIFSFGLLKHVTGFIGGAVLTRDTALEGKLRDELARYPPLSRSLLARKLMTGATYDIATFPPIFNTCVYWLFRHAYLHDLSFFNNKLDTDRSPVAYSDLPGRYAHRMSGAQADIIRSQFARCDETTRARIATAGIYHDGLKGLPGLVLPPHRSDGSHVYLNYTVQCEHRDRLALEMTRSCRDVQISHHRNCASLPCFARFSRDCPNAERAARNALYLPAYPGYREDQVRANIEVIQDCLRKLDS